LLEKVLMDVTYPKIPRRPRIWWISMVYPSTTRIDGWWIKPWISLPLHRSDPKGTRMFNNNQIDLKVFWIFRIYLELDRHIVMKLVDSSIPTSRTLQTFVMIQPNLAEMLVMRSWRTGALASCQGLSINCDTMWKLNKNFNSLLI
jgi:hypothetical protein